MTRRILILNGHPDPSPQRLCAGLCEAYAKGAELSRHNIRRIDVGALSFSFIHAADEFMAPVSAPDIEKAQVDIQWAGHIVLVYPLWLGSQPAILKGFLEQVFRYGFALGTADHGFPKRLLRGRSAHIMVTMGMPALIYRCLFGAFGTRALERSILKLSGIAPVRQTIIGGVGSAQTCRGAINKANLAGMKAA